MNKLKTIVIASLFAASTASIAFAETPADVSKGERAHKMHERMKAADNNADGKISREEANASLPRIAKNFDAIDADKDGLVTKDEMRAFREKNGGGKARKG